MDIERELSVVRSNLLTLKAELVRFKLIAKIRRREVATKAGFRPDQARDELGRWTEEGRNEGQNGEITAEPSVFSVNATFSDIASVPLSLRIAQSLADSGSDSAYVQAAEKIGFENALTGIDTIDQTTKKLTEILSNTMESADFIPNQTPQAYGVAVHFEFARRVRSNDLEGIGTFGVEQSFILGEVQKYGVAGSIRTDVILSDEAGRVLAIYDVKTGGAVLRPSRADDLRKHTRAGAYTPVIELHFERGPGLKHEPFCKDPGAGPACAARYRALSRRSGARTGQLRVARLLPEHDVAEAPHGSLEGGDAAAPPARQSRAHLRYYHRRA
ncbi:MAG: hypothetical protein QM576_02915 [Rhodopseudomonas sp.]|uniref:hypothetical protein n=1 Tax=Rhodopseudomonas sp. TaxID=1078 RepID=UPI0039E498E6